MYKDINVKEYKEYLEIQFNEKIYKINKTTIFQKNNFLTFKFKEDSFSKMYIAEDLNFYYLNLNGRNFIFSKNQDKSSFVVGETETNTKEIYSPLPGIISKIYIEKGQAVEKGSLLLIIESMKMENQILSPKTGIIEEIFVEQNQKVSTNQLLIKFKE